MRKLIIANWKMNGSTDKVEEILSSMKQELQTENKVVICPPSLYLSQAISILKDSVISCGAQDASQYIQGAYTGNISSSMLADIGVEYVILGHSERRQNHGETNEIVCDKIHLALQHGLIAIYCVGESKEVRKSGHTLDFIKRQVEPVLEYINQLEDDRIILAYEPIWAIGSGSVPSCDEISEVISYIKSLCTSRDIRVLYGGSVVANNASALLKDTGIDGLLVGGASLKTQEFLNICKG